MRPETRQYLKESDLEDLFTQALGWDHHTQSLNITVDETVYQLTAIAEKRGMVVFECPATGTDGRIPDYATRRKSQKRVAKLVHKNFIIYTDAERTTQNQSLTKLIICLTNTTALRMRNWTSSSIMTSNTVWGWEIDAPICVDLGKMLIVDWVERTRAKHDHLKEIVYRQHTDYCRRAPSETQRYTKNVEDAKTQNPRNPIHPR